MSASGPGAGIGAVVVSHYSAATLADCLQRLLAAEGVAAVAVVDNASGDASVPIARALADREPRLRVLANPGNPGFAVACNQGAARLATRWLAFVNPDLLVEADTLARLRALAESTADAGLIGADLVDAQGRRDPAARRREPHLRTLLAGAGSRGSLAIAPAKEQAVQSVDATSGALMLLPRGLFETLGGFDEGYRLHAEDLDLCRRVREAGCRVLVANDVHVLHLRGVSSRRRPLWVEWHKHRGMWRYYRKFEGRGRGPLVHALAFAAIFAHLPIAALRALGALRR